MVLIWLIQQGTNPTQPKPNPIFLCWVYNGICAFITTIIIITIVIYFFCCLFLSLIISIIIFLCFCFLLWWSWFFIWGFCCDLELWLPEACFLWFCFYFHDCWRIRLIDWLIYLLSISHFFSLLSRFSVSGSLNLTTDCGNFVSNFSFWIGNLVVQLGI